MVQNEVRESINGTNESGDSVSGIEAKRAKLKFKRATAADSAAFGSTSTATAGSPRKQRGISAEKRTQVSISDTGPESHKVRGKAPNVPVEEEAEDKPKVGRPRGSRKVLKPTLEDAQNTAKFLLSAIEMACVVSAGPTGEMTDFERGLMQAPLQRIIQRTPLSVVEKGGTIIDLGFLIVGGGIYFSRIFKGVNLPSLNKKTKGVQEDTRAPVAAPVSATVRTTKAGDVDGLAQPIPSVITQTMNGAI